MNPDDGDELAQLRKRVLSDEEVIRRLAAECHRLDHECRRLRAALHLPFTPSFATRYGIRFAAHVRAVLRRWRNLSR